MYYISCPACGAQVTFASTSAPVVICTYCQTSIGKKGEALASLGKVSAVLEDYSPVQLGTRGHFAGQPFTVVGRLQLGYEAGGWTEWYVLFADGSDGWLGDFSGQYSLCRRVSCQWIPGEQPRVDRKYVPGQKFRGSKKWYYISDIRTAYCTGGEGELPFSPANRRQMLRVDGRMGSQFATLEFVLPLPQDSARPLELSGHPAEEAITPASTVPDVYEGHAVSLSVFDVATLRTPDEILQTAGKYRGQIQTLSCPQCGHPNTFPVAFTREIHCVSCQALVQLNAAQQGVLMARQQGLRIIPRISPGQIRREGTRTWIMTGFVRWQTADDYWDEYVWFSPEAGFCWWVNTSQTWYMYRPLLNWPQIGPYSIVLDGGGGEIEKTLDCEARAVFVSGAFNWKLRCGDRVIFTDYIQETAIYASERTASELVFSRGTLLHQRTVKAVLSPEAIAEDLAALMTPRQKLLCVLALVLFNMPFVMSAGTPCLLVMLAGATIVSSHGALRFVEQYCSSSASFAPMRMAAYVLFTVICINAFVWMIVTSSHEGRGSGRWGYSSGWSTGGHK